MTRDKKALATFLALVGAAAVAGSMAQPDAWYESLVRPALAPPNIVFPIVWTALYVMMAVAAWRVWKIAGVDAGVKAWGVQLALNALWSPIFFGRHAILAALVVIAALWLAILVTTVLFFRRDKAAGWLMVPYLAWVSFATYLNAAFLQLNPNA